MPYIKNHPAADTDQPKVYVWYDPRNEKLAEAFAELKKLRTTEPPQRYKWLFAPALLLLCLGLSIVSEHTVVGIALCATGLCFVSAPSYLYASLTRRQFKQAILLTMRIKRGMFGWEFLWSDDPLWSALKAHLYDVHGIELLEDVMLVPEIEELAAPTLRTLILSTRETLATLPTPHGKDALQLIAKKIALLVRTAAQQICNDATPVWVRLDERNK